MRKKISLFLCVLLFASLLFTTASAVSYPEKTRYALDSAGVLSEATISDINLLNERLDDEANANIYVVTRHFLGGKDASQYADELFSAWNLGRSDALVLMVIGEDSYAISFGDTVRKALQGEAEAMLMGTYFRSPYLSRSYDGAVASLLPELAKKMAEAKGEKISLTGLFGKTEEQTSTNKGVFDWSDFITSGNVDWTDYSNTADVTTKTTNATKVEKVEKETGFSIGKLALILLIFYFLFGRKGAKNKYNFRHPPRR